MIAEVAEQQHGLITLAQLREAGLSPNAARHRAARGRLHQVHLGVYSVGHPLMTPDGRRMAAVLACSPGAVLSHRSAAAHWGFQADRQAASIDVTASNRRGRIPKGITAHRDGSLRLSDRTAIRGVPCTTVAKTLLDLAGVCGISELRKAVSEAEVLRLFDSTAVRAVIEQNRGRRGVARLRMLVSELDPQTRQTRSELERHFLAMCRQAEIPPPEVNGQLDLGGESLQPDFLWREARLIIETDGRKFHGTASAFESDRRRDQVLNAAGWRVVRCTWRQVLDEPARLARTFRTLLARSAADGPKT